VTVAKKKWGCLIGGGVILATVVSLCFTPAYNDTVGDVLAAANDYGTALDGAERVGAIIDPEKLFRRYGANGRPNAAPVYREASQYLFNNGLMKNENWPNVRKALESGSIDQLLTNLKPLRPIEPVLDRAAKIKLCDFAIRYDDPMGDSWESIPNMNLFRSIRLAEALVYSRKGDAFAALEQVRLANVICDHVGEGPHAPRMRSVMKRDLFAVLAKLITDHQHDAKFLAECRRFVSTTSTEVDLRRAVEEESVESLAMAEYISKNGMRELTDANTPFYEKWPVVTTAWKTRQLEYWTEVFKNLPSSRTDWRAWDAALSRTDHREETMRGFSNEMTMIVDRGLGRYGRSTSGTMEAYRDVLLSLLDIADWSLIKGKLPGHPPVSRPDPLGSGPLKFMRDMKMFKVWSVGTDGEDDGGSTTKSAYRDITFVFDFHP